MSAIQSHLDVVEEPFQAARDQFESIVQTLGSEKTQGMTHSEVEVLLHHRGTEVLRQLFQGFLDSLGEGQATEVVRNAEGVILKHNVQEERRLETLFGTVRLCRHGYRQREATTVYPIDAKLNLPERKYSFGVERRVVEESIHKSFDHTVEGIARTTGAHVAKRQVEEIVIRAAMDFDTFYEEVERSVGEKTGSILVISADGKGVVMLTKDLREVTQKAAQTREHKLTTRLSKGEKRNAKRMAEVAAVYSIEPHIRSAEEVIGKIRPVRKSDVRPPKPEHKRVWASLAKESEEVFDAIFREALRRDPMRLKQWVALVDGNKTQLRLLKKYAKKYEVELIIVVDFIHALEYLWLAGNALLGEGKKATEDWVLERALRVLNGKASQVAAGIRRSATLRDLTGNARKALDKCANYLLENAKSMRYDVCLSQGYPIATGVIEGACRHLVKDRMDITGARWGLARAEAILQLRALKVSGDFDAYWTFHESNEYGRNQTSKYFNSRPAQTRIPNRLNRSHLEIVK